MVSTQFKHHDVFSDAMFMPFNLAGLRKPTLVWSFKRVQVHDSTRVRYECISYIILTKMTLSIPKPIYIGGPMQGFSTRILLRKNQILGPVTASIPLTKQISYISKQSRLPFPQILPFCLLSTQPKTGFPTPVYSSLQSFRAMAGQSQSASVHDFTVKDARGQDVDLSQYKGKALLIVNVASQCGLTNSNYSELTELYGKYKDQGLEILAFPCNQFGAQEPGNNEQIVEFACTRFKADFPIFDKVDVNGNTAAPLYKFLKSSKGGLFGDNIKWNFSKFLVDKDGKVIERYAPTTSPLSIEKDIKKLLATA